jgi:hypothetical protein
MKLELGKLAVPVWKKRLESRCIMHVGALFEAYYWQNWDTMNTLRRYVWLWHLGLLSR